MPEIQGAGQPAPESWTQESVEKQATEIEQQTTPQGEGETQPQGEQAEGDSVEVQEKVKTQKVVSHHAFHSERERRKEAQAVNRQLQEQNVMLMRQMQEFMARQGQAQQPQIDPTDTLGVMQHGIQQTAAEVRAMREADQRRQQESMQQQQYQNFVSAVKAQEAEFLQEQPDAHEAIGFLKQNRVNEYKAAGLSQTEAVQRMLKDELDLVTWAMNSGENPAKAAFDMAVQRGYVAPNKKLEMQRNGQGASTPSGGGGKGGGLPSLEALLKMSSTEFAKATAGENWEKLLKKHS